MREEKLRLFYALEGGDNFWSKELRDLTAPVVLERILNGGYEKSSKSITRALSRLHERSAKEIGRAHV